MFFINFFCTLSDKGTEHLPQTLVFKSYFSSAVLLFIGNKQTDKPAADKKTNTRFVSVTHTTEMFLN